MTTELPKTFVAGFHDEDEVRKMQYSPLGDTGMLVSKLSLGTGGFSYFYGDYQIEELKKIVHDALKRGINFIDTAPWYGHGVSETILGECLKGIPRNAYYLATKVGRYEKDPHLMFNFTAEKTKSSIDTSLKRLGIDYIDLIQVHDVEFAENLDVVINETLPVLQDAVKSGKAKHIGITGYPVSTLQKCLDKSASVKIETILSYCRLTLIDDTLKEFIPAFKSKKLGIINAAAHSMGLLSNFGPPDWHPATDHIKSICLEARNYCIENNVELGKLALYYTLQQKGPDTVLVGMNKYVLLDFNFDVLYNGLNEKEQKVLEYIQKNIFCKLKEKHWENVELERYWKTIKGDK